jgi:nitroreductase
MKFSELVQKRQSTRKFSDRPVPREMIEQCLEAARFAPSACNSQPWSFVVVEELELKNRLVREAMGGVYKTNAFVMDAPLLVVIVTEASSYIARLGGYLRHVKYNLIDIGVAGEHLVLQAAELGLGTCWLGWFKESAVRRVLGLPRQTQIDVMIAMGFPAVNDPLRPKLRKPLAEVARFSGK